MGGLLHDAGACTFSVTAVVSIFGLLPLPQALCNCDKDGDWRNGSCMGMRC